MQEISEHSLVIGITGGFGSGKSTVAGIISEQDFPVVLTDDLAKSLMADNSDIKKRLIDYFGETVYSDDGSLNKTYLSDIVFAGTEESKTKLARLNSIVHPFVIDEMMRLVDDYENKGEKLIFVESALIYEAGLDEGFDYIINVSSDIQNIIDRASKRNIPETTVRKRLDEQMSVQKKHNLADFNIENNSDLAALKNSVLTILEVLKALI